MCFCRSCVLSVSSHTGVWWTWCHKEHACAGCASAKRGLVKEAAKHALLLALTHIRFSPLSFTLSMIQKVQFVFHSVRKSGSILSKTTASVLLIYTLTKYNKNNIYFIHTHPPVCGVTCSNLSKLREPDVVHHVIQCVWHAGGLCVQDQPGLCSESRWRGKEWFFIFFPSHSFLLQTVNTSGRTVRTFSVFTLYLFVLCLNAGKAGPRNGRTVCAMFGLLGESLLKLISLCSVLWVIPCLYSRESQLRHTVTSKIV